LPAGLGGGAEMSPKQKAILAQGGSVDAAASMAAPDADEEEDDAE
jgi:hypothetical protein